MSDATVAYNPSDSLQSRFLGAIRATESNGDYHVGYSNVDLSGYPVDAYGFPQWGGKTTSSGPTHAAGAYQFQPGTWKSVASKYNLNFQSKADQDAGAWYLAQSDYTARTGRSLTDDLATGSYAKVASALKTTWTSISAGSVAKGMSSELQPGPSNEGSTPSLISDPIGAISTYFVRGGMVLVGSVILAIALWAMLSRANVLPNAVALGR